MESVDWDAASGSVGDCVGAVVDVGLSADGEVAVYRSYAFCGRADWDSCGGNLVARDFS